MRFSLALAYGSGYIVNFTDLLPAYSSIVFGIATAAATFGALMANVIAGLVIKRPVLEDWRKIFILFSIIYVIGGVAFLIFGSAVPPSWALLKAHEPQPQPQMDDVTINAVDEEETVPMTIVAPNNE